MKLTTRSRYGLRAMVYIALNDDGTPIALSQIATELELSDHYLEQLLRSLKNAGILESVRGAQGGYHLARPADRITVGDMLRVLEGPLWLSDCVHAGDCPGGRTECSTRMVICRMSEGVRSVVDSMTLADMVEHEHLV